MGVQRNTQQRLDSRKAQTAKENNEKKGKTIGSYVDVEISLKHGA